MKVKALVAALVALGASLSANANTVYTHDFSNLGQLTSPNSITASFSSVAGSGLVDFVLNGYRSLDGNDPAIDVFTLTINNVNVLSGSFNMGGGGTSGLFYAPTGTTWSLTTYGVQGCKEYPCTWGKFQGGSTKITVPFELLAGANDIVFSYDSPTFFDGKARGGPQKFSDEAWGLGLVTVTSVPEPDSYAMMLAGLGLMGFVASRRKV